MGKEWICSGCTKEKEQETHLQASKYIKTIKFGKGKRFESDEEMHAACAVNMHSRNKAADIHQAVNKTKVF